MYALVDCNSFYASCEQIFRPDLRGKPLVVLSNNDGCIVARSKEAKELDVPDLKAYFQLKDFLEANHVHVFSSNYALYGDISNRVMETLKYFSPDIEIYSIDEMFLSLDGFSNDLKVYGHEIKDKVWQYTRMPVGVGIAPTKTLAKLANHAAKKIPQCNGVCVLDTSAKWEWLLRRLAANKVWGVGKKLSKKLAANGIHTAWDLSQADKKLIRQIGSVCLERTASELTGVECLGLDVVQDKKQIYSTRSFGKKVTALSQLHEAITLYATRACEKLRKQKYRVKTIHVFLQTSPFSPNYYAKSIVVQLPYATDDSRLVIHYAKAGIEQIFLPDRQYSKAGIGLIELVAKDYSQQDFFCRGQPLISDKVMSTLDAINKKYGRGTAFIAAQGIRKPWVMRQNFKSPAYTTQWSDLPVIRVW
jgi:DNA polymerase V